MNASEGGTGKRSKAVAQSSISIAVLGSRGGIGCTGLAVNLGCCLSQDADNSVALVNEGLAWQGWVSVVIGSSIIAAWSTSTPTSTSTNCIVSPLTSSTILLYSSVLPSLRPLGLPWLDALYCFTDKLISTMKSTAVLAVAGLVSTVHAGVHKLKLNKVPLEQQLVSNQVQLLPTRPDADCFLGSGKY